MSASLDMRRFAARPDLAAAELEGQVAAERFVEGRAMRIVREVADVRGAPRPDAPLSTQALYGERITVYEDDEGWVWGQLARDRYVGYLDATSIAPDDGGGLATHRVGVPRTFVYPGLSMKAPVVMGLPLGAPVEVVAERGEFCEARGLGCIWKEHLAPIGAAQADFVAIAEMFEHAPYLWGGKTWLGLDCSGLVQIALHEAGIEAPRDTDMQAAEIGAPVAARGDLAGLRRGDLVFWKGHVGIMRDAATLLHANGRHMRVASEPLAAARDRIAANSYGPITAIRRPAV
jgi:cell wall-associated NlpC family hydrolase